jgi:transcriptional regulator with XRE-family HTH domain
VESRRPTARGPYVRSSGRAPADLGRPADALAANLRAYRLLRHLTQDELATQMTRLGHGWGRSTVSAVEARARNVTVDELCGLTLCLGVTVCQLLDPAGPDRSRRMSLDVGLRHPETGLPEPVEPALARLWASSRTVIRLSQDNGGGLEVDHADDAQVDAVH